MRRVSAVTVTPVKLVSTIFLYLSLVIKASLYYTYRRRLGKALYRLLTSISPTAITDLRRSTRYFELLVLVDSPTVIQYATLRIGISPIPLRSENSQLIRRRVKGAAIPLAHPIEFSLILGYANFITSAQSITQSITISYGSIIISLYSYIAGTSILPRNSIVLGKESSFFLSKFYNIGIISPILSQILPIS